MTSLHPDQVIEYIKFYTLNIEDRPYRNIGIPNRMNNWQKDYKMCCR